MARFVLTSVLACLLLAGRSEGQIDVAATLELSGLTHPLYVAAPPGDFQRLFIVEQEGVVKLWKNSTLSVFLDIQGLVTSNGDRGLLGFAFHPDYANNGYFYVNYTDGVGDSVVARYSRSADPDVADAGSAVVILGPVFQPQINHNGSCLQFGPDGKLYIGMGDGGSQKDQGTGHPPAGNGQTRTTLLGKILRLDVDLPSPHIPADNPFVGDPNTFDEIWALGVRMPWRFSFDRLTGDLYMGDVGQDRREEINFEPAGFPGGRNYGWKCMEGLDCTQFGGCTCNAPHLTLPIAEYVQGGLGRSITGGYVYRGCSIPSLYGYYVYTDFKSARFWAFTYDGTTKGPTIEITSQLAPGGGLAFNGPASFGEDAAGELYVCDHIDGELYKIVSGSPTSPTVYCTPKAGLACGPTAITSSGMPGSSATTGFTIQAGPARSNKLGILIYSDQGRATAPFHGGLLCIMPPVRRSTHVSSGGTPGGCDGTFAIDMNAFAAGGLGGNPQAYLVQPGQQVNAQFWGRDSVSTGAYLSDALEYVVCP